MYNFLKGSKNDFQKYFLHFFRILSGICCEFHAGACHICTVNTMVDNHLVEFRPPSVKLFLVERRRMVRIFLHEKRSFCFLLRHEHFGQYSQGHDEFFFFVLVERVCSFFFSERLLIFVFDEVRAFLEMVLWHNYHECFSQTMRWVKSASKNDEEKNGVLRFEKVVARNVAENFNETKWHHDERTEVITVLNGSIFDVIEIEINLDEASD